MMTSNFYKIWVSQALSQITTNMIIYILAIRIFSVTHSSISVALLIAIYTIPALLLGIFAGVFVDRWSKHDVLVVTNLIQAAIVFSLLGLGSSIWPAYSLIFLYSIVERFYGPSEISYMPSLVPSEKLPQANSYFFLTANSALMIGYGISGPVARLLGSRAPFLIGTLFLLIAALVTYLLPRDKVAQTENQKSNGFESVWEDLREGVNYVKSKKKVLYPFLFYAFAQMFIGSVIVLFPQFTQEVLKINLYDSGFVLVVPAGFGAVTGLLLMDRVLPILGRRYAILISVFGAGFALLGLSLIASMGVRIFAAAFFVYLLALFMVHATSPVLAFLQEGVPMSHRGRVFSGLTALITISAGLPVLITATLADVVGSAQVYGILAILIIITGFYLTRRDYVNLSLQKD